MRTQNKYYTLFLLMILAGSLFSCKEEVLEPSVSQSIILYFNGEIDGVPFSYRSGKGIIVEPGSFMPDSLARHFTFDFIDTLQKETFPMVELSFRSAIRIGDNMPFNIELDSTFLPGPKEFYMPVGNPANPFQLSTFACYINDSTGRVLSTESINGINIGNVMIDSVNDIRWIDEKYYKLVYLSLDCQLFADTTSELSNGKALIAFPRE